MLIFCSKDGDVLSFVSFRYIFYFLVFFIAGTRPPAPVPGVIER